MAFDYIFRGAPTVPVPGLSPALGFDYLNSVLYVTGAVNWVAIGQGGSGSGTVTSIGLTVPQSIFTLAGSPVTTFGNITLGLANQAAHTVFAGPVSGTGAPTFRALVSSDIPSGSSTNFVTSEIPSGAVDGMNVTFMLANLPLPGTLALYQEGARLSTVIDYTLSAVTITFITAPKPGDLLLADYRF